jgi:hypothetical protein
LPPALRQSPQQEQGDVAQGGRELRRRRFAPGSRPPPMTQALRPAAIHKPWVVKDFQEIRRGVHAEASVITSTPPPG